MTPSAPDTTTIDPRRALSIIRRNLRIFVLMLVIAPTVGVFGARLMPQVYKAQARVLVQDSNQVNPLLEDLIVPWKVNNRVPIMTSVLKSNRTILAVLTRMGVVAKGAIDDEAVEEKVRAFKGRVDTFAIGGGLVAISLTSTSPTEAKEGLQALVDEFVEEMLRPQKQSVEGSATFLAGQLARLRGELAALETELTTYKTDNADELPEVYKLNLDTWLSLRKQMTTVDVKMQTAGKRRDLLAERLRIYDPVVRELEQRLITLQARQRELQATFRDDAPDVVEGARKIAALEDELKKAQSAGHTVDIEQLQRHVQVAVDLSTDGTAASHSSDMMTGEIFAWKQAVDDLEGAAAERALLEQRVAEAEKAVRSFARNEATLNRLNRDFETKSAVYRNLLEKYEDALVTRELSTFNEKAQVWIVDPPTLPRTPQNPPIIAVAAGALVGGQVIALLIAVALDLLAGTMASPVEVSRRLGLAPLGDVPWNPTEKP